MMRCAGCGRSAEDGRDATTILDVCAYCAAADSIRCDGGCGRTTSDPDRWDPDPDTGRVLCDVCFDGFEAEV